MSRRSFLQRLTVLIGGFALPATALLPPSGRGIEGEGTTWKPLQVSPLAGFQYHHGATLWPQLAVGQPVQLVREPSNPYDARAVRVDWQGHKLGYIPRLDNAAASQLLDRGEQLEAVIAGLVESNDPWQRVRVEVRWLI